MKRTAKQKTKDNSNAIEQINSIKNAHKMLNDFKIIHTQPLSEKQIDTITKKICKIHNVDINFINKLMYGK